jgi:hypothetical protein
MEWRTHENRLGEDCEFIAQIEIWVSSDSITQE